MYDEELISKEISSDMNYIHFILCLDDSGSMRGY